MVGAKGPGLGRIDVIGEQDAKTCVRQTDPRQAAPGEELERAARFRLGDVRANRHGASLGAVETLGDHSAIQP